MKKFKLVLENDYFVVIDKFPDIVFSSELVKSVEDEVSVDKVFPVHRLDRETSGLMIFAKSSEIARQFSDLLSKGRIEKTYIAIVLNTPKKKMGIVIGDMERSRRSQWKLMRTKVNPAKTGFKQYTLDIKIKTKLEKKEFPEKQLKLIELKPHTGKTHQLRVALKSLGTSVLGDEIYGDKYLKIEEAEGFKPVDRMYLHAYRLKFGLNDKSYSIDCVPTIGKLFEMEKILEKLKEI